MGMIINKPYNKDSVLNQPVIQWKVRPGFFRGSAGESLEAELWYLVTWYPKFIFK